MHSINASVKWSSITSYVTILCYYVSPRQRWQVCLHTVCKPNLWPITKRSRPRDATTIAGCLRLSSNQGSLEAAQATDIN